MTKRKDKSGKRQLELIPASNVKQEKYTPVKSQFDSPKRQEGVIDILMSENAFFTLSKKDTEDFEYVSPEGKFELRARVLDKTLGLPTINDSLIIHYVGAIMRDSRLDEGEGNAPRFVDIQAKEFFDFFGKTPSGQAYADFQKAIQRLSGTEYEIIRLVDPATLDPAQAPEYEEGDVVRIVEADRLIKSHKRLEIEKRSGKTVVTAVRIEMCDWLRYSLSNKRTSLLIDRDLYLSPTPLLFMVSQIIRKQMGDKLVHTISYDKLRHRCRSKQDTPKLKQAFKEQVKKHGMIGFNVDLGDSHSTTVTFHRVGKQEVLGFEAENENNENAV